MATHTKDSDCTIDPETDLCTGCGAKHGAPCYHCRAHAFHRPGCIVSLGRRHETRVSERNRDYPDADDPGQFVCVRTAVLRNGARVATAVSKTMAKRIARALNLYKPAGREGA